MGGWKFGGLYTSSSRVKIRLSGAAKSGKTRDKYMKNEVFGGYARKMGK